MKSKITYQIYVFVLYALLAIKYTTIYGNTAYQGYNTSLKCMIHNSLYIALYFLWCIQLFKMKCNYVNNHQKKDGWSETDSPTYCMIDDWENGHNIRHTRQNMPDMRCVCLMPSGKAAWW